MKVRAADTAVGDLDVDVILRPLLGLEAAPPHLALDGIGRLSEPPLELVVGSHYMCSFGYRKC